MQPNNRSSDKARKSGHQSKNQVSYDTFEGRGSLNKSEIMANDSFDKAKANNNSNSNQMEDIIEEHINQVEVLQMREDKDNSNINNSQSIKDPAEDQNQFKTTQPQYPAESRLSHASNLSQIQPGTIIEANKPLYEQIFKHISYNDVLALKALLEREGSAINVIEIKDARKFTVLSFSCYKNTEECFMILYNHALDKNLSSLKFEQKKYILSEWANSPTDEEFTALHFATYHGSYTLIKFLIGNASADIEKKNKFGSSVMHIAAQGDQALPIYFFKQKGMDINIKDNRLSTPLHWACYSKSEVALNYILSMNPEIDAQDQKGFTPLHLAVKSVEALKSTRPVRALLLKGANRLAKDFEGRTAVDMISDALPDAIRMDLKTMLKKPSYWECLMIKTPLIPLKPNHKTQLVFWSIFVLTYINLWLIIFPNQNTIAYAIASTVIGLLIIIAYILAISKDAGTLKPDKELDFLELLHKFNPTELCPDCKVIRTQRSRHCAICNVCIERFDHHCPWINNCVGVNNHNYFLSYLAATWIFCSFVLAMTIDSLLRFRPAQTDVHPLHALCFQEWCQIDLVFMIFGIIDFILAFLFFFPISLLLYVHLKNYSLGKTTNERFARKAQNSFSEDGSNYDTDYESDSLVGGSSSRNTLIGDEEAPQKRATGSRKTKRKLAYKKNCFGNWMQMTCNKEVISQKALYEKQSKLLERGTTIEIREATNTQEKKSRHPNKLA